MASQLVIVGGIENEAVASAYSETTEYSINDYCTKDSRMYRCIEATTGEFNDTKWKLTTCSKEIGAVNDKLNDLSFAVCTLSEYEALEVKDSNTLYFIKSE